MASGGGACSRGGGSKKKSKGGKGPKIIKEGEKLRSTATGPAAASRAKGSGLSFFSEDYHNSILDVQGLNASGD